MADNQQNTPQTGQSAGSFSVPGAPSLQVPQIRPQAPAIPPAQTPAVQSPAVPQSPPSFVLPPPRTPAGVIQQPAAPLYVRPAQNTTEPPRPATSKPAGETGPVGPAPELRTSIRTLADDLLKLKMGQRPSGMEMSRTLGSAESRPVPQKSLGPIAQRAPSPAPATSVPIARQMPVPQAPAGQGPAVKTGPSITVTVPPLRQQEQKGLGIFPGQKQQASAPGQPALGAPRQQAAPKDQSPITEFASSVLRDWGWNLRKVIFVAVPVMGAAAMIVYALFLRPSSEPIVIPTGTPDISASETPQPSTTQQPVFIDLPAIFGTTAEPVRSMMSPNLLPDFYRELLAVSVESEQLKRISISTETEKNKSLNFLELLDWLSVAYPKGLNTHVGSGHIELLYGQKEAFSDSGTLLFNQPIQQRLAFILEVSDAEAVTMLMKQWESTMAADLAGIFAINPERASGGSFIENKKTGSLIMYMNFPYADRSIDYAIISRGDKQTFLVLTNSRELTFVVLGKF